MEPAVTLPADDLDYYHRRAAAQLELAQRTELTAAVAAHMTIAERYLDLCEPARQLEVDQRKGRPRLRPIAA